MESCAVNMIKEIQTHHAQCMAHEDEVSKLAREAMTEILQDEGVHSARELQDAHAKRDRDTSRKDLGKCILGRGQTLLRSDGRITTAGWTRERPEGTLMAEALHNREDEWEIQQGDVVTGTREEEEAAVKARDKARQSRKALKALHRADIFSLESLQDGEMGDSGHSPLYLPRYRGAQPRTSTTS